MSRIDPGKYNLLKVSGMLDGKTNDSKQILTILDLSPSEIDNDYVFDFAKVDYINSSMIGMLVKFLSSCHEAKRNMILLSPSKAVGSVLEMVGLTAIISIVDNEAEACEILGVPFQPRPEIKDIDYESLSEEIEDIIVSADAEEAVRKRQEGELRKLLGN